MSTRNDGKGDRDMTKKGRAPFFPLDQLYVELLRTARRQGVTLEQIIAVLCFLNDEHEKKMYPWR
jgi:hypothetical protein